MKTNRHSLMAKGIMVLLSLLVLIFAFTYSWFSIDEPDADTTGFSAKVHGSSDFEYAIGYKTEKTLNRYVHTAFTNAQSADLNLKALNTVDQNNNVIKDSDNNPITYDLLEDYVPIDVTGTGSTLVRPSMEYGNWKVDTSTVNYSIAEPNVQYISFDLIVRANNPCVVSLDKNSYAKGACETTPGDGRLSPSSGDAVNKSKYGNFSKDAIVGAVRVAFVGYDNSADSSFNTNKLLTEEQTVYNSAPELLWIPRPDIYLDNHDDGTNNYDLKTEGWSLVKNVTPGTTFNLYSEGQEWVQDSNGENGYSTYVHQYYDVFDSNPTKTFVVDTSEKTKTSSIVDNTVKFNQSSNILEVNLLDDANNDGVHNSNEYYYGKVRVRIWLEGTDSESRRALADGEFSIEFDLTTN